MKIHQTKFLLLLSVFFLNQTIYSRPTRVNETNSSFLKQVLDKLNTIQSASYTFKSEGWAPGDKAPSSIHSHYSKEYNNPNDTAIGASYVLLDSLTKSKASFCYDGNMRAVFYSDSQVIVVDSFNVRKLPFRPVTPPFYNYTRSIIQYILSTKDSIILEMKELPEAVFCRLTINEEKQVEFFGKATYIPESPYYTDPLSVYEIWINKETLLPYKYRRALSHDISVKEIISVEFNNVSPENFIATDYFPKTYRIEPYKIRKRTNAKNFLTDLKAPDWELISQTGSKINLNGLKSKVKMIQFTSVSCGPCRMSIPFLNKLQNIYKKGEFDFVAIECSTQNIEALKRYSDKNSIQYKFLHSTKTVLNDYQITGFPVFFILDSENIVRHVINGYAVDKTDNEITQKINQMLKKNN